MLKVLHVLEACQGGTSRYIATLIQEQIKLGLNVSLFYSSQRIDSCFEKLIEELKSKNVHLYDMNISRLPYPKDIYIVIRLLFFSLKHKPDIICGHSSKAGGLIRLLKIIHPKQKCVYAPHAYFGMSGAQNIKTTFFNYIERILANVCEKIHHSKEENEFSERVLGSKVKYIIIRPPIEFRAMPKAQGLEKRSPHIRLGWLGRFEYQKACDLAFPLINNLLLKRNEFSFTVGGWGTMENQLAIFEHLKAESRFEFMGRVDNIDEFFSRIDFLILTSRFEAGIPIVAVETLLYSKGLIFNHAPGINSTNEIPHILAKSFDINSKTSLEKALDEAIKESKSFDFSKQLNTVYEIFDSKKQTQKIVDFYKEIIAS